MSYAHPSKAEVAARRAQLAPMDGHNERAWLALFVTILMWRESWPASYLDLGSGTGAMVNVARKIGIEAIGVDVINGPEHWFAHHDLNEPLRLAVRYDLITCLEVAEHLDSDSGPVLCDTIARHLAPGGLLVFSAAPPGQAGEHHTNCRPARYWRGLLHERGVSYREDYTRQLSHLWDIVSGPASHWIAANVQVFDTWDGVTL